MSSSEVDDYFDIPAECNPAKGRELTCKPLWSSAEAHLNPQAQDEVVFLATNSKSSQANPRDKISSKLLKAMELVHQESSPRVRSSGQSEHADVCAVRESGNPELGVLDTWNPMAEDYKSKAFNSYKEPTVIDFVKSFPGNSNQSSQLFANSKSAEGEVKLFVGRIPQQMTQEGLNNLFSQVGKLVSCKLITQHMKDTNIGFVGYSTVHEAETAIQKFDGLDVGQGNRLKVALALTKQKPVYVDHEETVHTVNGVTDSEESRQKETSLEDNVSPSNKAGISYAGKPCNFCGQLGLKWCSVCKIPYCSRECQKHDWPKHKLICLQQASAERKMTNSGTSALLTTTPGDTLQSTEQKQKQTDFSQAPSGLYVSEEHVASKAPWDSEEDTESSAENERDPLRVDGFDVNNVEMFAEMLGFDMSQMKFVEKSQDSDESDKSSSCSLDSSKVQEASSKSPVPATPPKDSPSPHIVHTEQARGLSSGTLTQALITPSVTTSSEQVAKSASQKPSCFEGYKRFFIKELSMEPVPTDGSFEAVVTDVENPSCVWAQLCTPEALERQDQLKTKLQVLYSNSSHEKYVPSVGEVCVAQFSFDSEWYRAKVDIVNNTGTLRVTFIDFGNHEDVTVEKIRRITEDLVAFPRQALKLSLHGIASSCPSGNWSSEATSFLKSKVLSIKCKVQVSRQHNEILFVQLYDPQETSFGATINESLIASGFAKTRERPVSSQNSPQQYSTSQQWRGSPLSPQLNADPKYPEQKRGFHGTERQPVYQASNCQGQVNQIKSPSLSGGLSGGKSSGSKEFSNLSRNLPGSAVKKESFEVIINAIVNPWEFYAQKTNPELVDKLNDLMTDLNKHMSTSSFPLQSQTFSCGQLCAAKFSLDNLWYRAVILEMLSNAVRVRYTDFGNSEVVPSNSISPLPQTFQGFPPLSLRCSLAGVTKPKGRDWSVEAVQHFKSLVCGKSFICRIVHQHDIVSIVELQDPEPNREQTVAKSLISAGLADAFFHKDGTKHQLVGKRGSSMMGSQEQVNRGTPEQKSTFNDSHNPPLGFQGFSSNNSGGPSRDNHSDHENPPQGSQSHNAGKESHNHISKTQQNASPPEGQVKKPPVHGLLQSLVFQPAIEKAELPKENACFDAMLTEVTKMGLFFVQVADHDTAQKLKNLSDDLNAHYRSTKLSFFSPQPHLLCAALFAETGDWCRAMVKGVTADGLVDVYYVDFGNTEKVPVSRIQSLLNKFASVPFFALPCYLANISQPEPPGWSDQAMALIMKKTPLFQCASVRLLEKGCDMLFIDFVISMDPPQSLSELLLNEGLAKRALTCDMEAQQARGIEVCVFEPAVKSVEGLDVFDAMLTDVSSPSSFFIQVLHRDNVESLKQLSADLNAHYTTAEYPPFQAQINKMCAGLFSESNDWCRGFIDGVNSDSSVHVHYLDYGNSELLPCSKVRPLELRFQHPCPMALRCSLTGVFPAHSNSWSHNAKEAFLSQAPLNSLLKVRVVGRESGLLYVDVISPDSPCQESLSHFLISQGLACVNPLLDPSLLSYSGGLDSDIRLYASAVPLVSVPQGMTCRVLISEVQLPDKIFFQVLSKENVQGLLSLSETLHTHCSTVDNVPYKPVLGEVCCAKFIDDQTWYRAVVKQKMSESEMMVVFVDYGNQAVVSVDSIRRITPSFTQLPIQARECFLLNIEPVSGSSWSNNAVAFLKERLTSHVPEPFFAEISNTRADSLGVKLFEISPDGQPGKSVREEMIQLGLARGQDEAGNSVLPMIVPNLDQFDVVVTEVVHPGEIWVQVVDAEASIALDMLMKDINQYCSEAPMPTSMSQPGQECCAQFSQDCLWYRARVLECPSSEQVRVQFVDFGNSELSSPDKIRAMTDEFFKLPAQALKLSLANICPTHQVWSQEAAQWLKAILNRQLKATVVHRLPEHLVVLLEDWNVPNGPINISQELVNTGYAVNS